MKINVCLLNLVLTALLPTGFVQAQSSPAAKASLAPSSLARTDVYHVYFGKAAPGKAMRKAYPAIPRHWTSAFGGMQDDDYLKLLRKTIVADSDPQNVILLEIEPAKQKTRIDFACTESILGISPVSATDISKRGRQLFYRRDGREVPIERIYNRVIFDELLRRPELNLPFSFQEELEIVWIGHPNWYFRISKHSLPFLKSPYSSSAFFAQFSLIIWCE